MLIFFLCWALIKCIKTAEIKTDEVPGNFHPYTYDQWNTSTVQSVTVTSIIILISLYRLLKNILLRKGNDFVTDHQLLFLSSIPSICLPFFQLVVYEDLKDTEMSFMLDTS